MLPSLSSLPILDSKKKIGEGYSGIVYGPYRSVFMIDFMRNMFCQKTMSSECRQLLQDYFFAADAQYVIKILRKDVSSPCHSSLLDQLPDHLKSRFIFPIICSEQTLEVQRYGGVDFAQELKRRKTWADIKRPWQCLAEMMEACFYLIDRLNRTITDIKPRNMTYDSKTNEIFMIDIEAVSLDEESINVIFTNNPKWIPIQFINKRFFPSQDRRRTQRNKYIARSKRVEDHEIMMQVSDERLRKIATLTVAWALLHTAYYLLRIHSLQRADEFHHLFLAPLQTVRLDVDSAVLLETFRSFIP